MDATRTASSLIRAGFDVRTDLARDYKTGRLFPSRLIGTKGIAVVSAIHNGRSLTELTCLHVQRSTEQADAMTDYFPGAYFDSVRQAINHANYIAAR